MAVCISWLRVSHRVRLTIAFAMSVLSVQLSLSPHVHAQSAAVAASGEPYRIALMVDSTPDGGAEGCYYRGHTAAIEKFAKDQADIINAMGGIDGRPLEVDIRDGYADSDKTIADTREVLKFPRLLALIGFTSSRRSEKIFSELKNEINESGIPVIAHVSASKVFADMPNTFSTRISQKNGQAPVIKAFIDAAAGRDKVALISRNGEIFVEDLRAGFDEWIKGQVSSYTDYRIDEISENKKTFLNDAALDNAIAKISSKKTNLVVLAVGYTHIPQVVDKLVRQFKSESYNVKPTVMILGRPSESLSGLSKDYNREFFFLDLDDVPEVEQDTIRNKVNKHKTEDWFFGDRKNKDAPGWQDGTCKDLQIKDVFSQKNIDSIRYGGQFADMIALVAKAIEADAASLRTTGLDEQKLIARKHKAVIKSLKETYTVGCSAFKGRFENWSFDADTRSRAKLPFLLIAPPDLGGSTQLAQKQFVQIRPRDLICRGEKKLALKKILRPIDTLYLDIDLERIYGVDDNQRFFYADFYLSMRASEDLFGKRNDSYSDKSVLNTIRFDNAFVNSLKGGPDLTIEPIYTGKETNKDKKTELRTADGNRSAPAGQNREAESEIYPKDMRIYYVSGRFRFAPEFKDYPFDKQKFSIDIKPKSGEKLFVVQPPPLELRDQNVDAKNWQETRDGQYVSYTEQLLPMVDAFTHNPSVVPLYKSRFVWELQREVRDYLVQVIIPLALMLLIAYLSVFIPQRHLEAIITLQVTALLAAVALYLSLPQVDSDTATVSDRFFMLDYAMVSLMIFISIVRIHVRPQEIENNANADERADKAEQAVRQENGEHIARWRKICDYALLFTHMLAIPMLVIWFLISTMNALPEEATNQLTSDRLARAILALGN